MELLRLRLESRGDEPGSGTSIKDILYPRSSHKKICNPLADTAVIIRNYCLFLEVLNNVGA